MMLDNLSAYRKPETRALNRFAVWQAVKRFEDLCLTGLRNSGSVVLDRDLECAAAVGNVDVGPLAVFHGVIDDVE